MRKHAIAIVGITLAILATQGMGSALAQMTVVTPAPPLPPAPPSVIVQQAPQEPQPVRIEVNTPAPAPAPQPIVVNNMGGENRGLLRTSRALIGTGITLFGVIYVSTAIAAAVTSDVCAADASLGCREAVWPIYIPVLGPFIQMGYVSGTGANSARALLAVDGVLQAGGLAMAITGIVLHASAMMSSSRPAYSRFQLTPSNVGSGTGLVAFGRF